MSPRDWKLLVNDILEAIGKIVSYVESLDLDEFRSDDKTFDAVIRNFITIGESANQMPREIIQKYPDIPWRLMNDMRNFAVHHYWGVDASVVWKTIHDDLPSLKVKLDQIVRGS